MKTMRCKGLIVLVLLVVLVSPVLATDELIWKFDNFENKYKIFGSYTCDIGGIEACPSELGWQGDEIKFKFKLSAVEKTNLPEVLRFNFRTYKLKDVYISIYAGNSLKLIKSNMFVDQSGLYSVEIPSAVFSEGNNDVQIRAHDVNVGYGQPPQAFVLSYVSLEETNEAYESPILRCPVDGIGKSYPFKWWRNDYDSLEKAQLEISYKKSFSTKVKSDGSTDLDVEKIRITEIYSDIEEMVIEKSKRGRMYARMYVEDNIKGVAYSNICEFKLKDIEVLNPKHWTKSGEYIITKEKPYYGKKSLVVPYYSDVSTSKFIAPDLTYATIFGSKKPFDLSGSTIIFKIATPDNCGGAYGKNYLQIHLDNGRYGGTILFRGKGWETVEMEIPDTVYYEHINGFSIKIGTFGKCNGNFYIDDFRIIKDGKTAMYNFE